MIGEMFEILCSLVLISIAIPLIFFTLSVYIEKKVVEREVSTTLSETISYLRKIVGDRQMIIDGFPYCLRVLRDACDIKANSSKEGDAKTLESNNKLKVMTIIFFGVFCLICFVLMVLMVLLYEISRKDVSIMSVFLGIIIFVLVEVLFVIMVVQYYRVTDMRQIVTDMLQAIPNHKTKI